MSSLIETHLCFFFGSIIIDAVVQVDGIIRRLRPQRATRKRVRLMLLLLFLQPALIRRLNSSPR